MLLWQTTSQALANAGVLQHCSTAVTAWNPVWELHVPWGWATQPGGSWQGLGFRVQGLGSRVQGVRV